MKTLQKSLLAFIATTVASLSAYAGTGGSNPVISDSTHNTAMGTDALFSLTNGGWNTAAGENALYFTTTGSSNTALGYQALLDNTTGESNTASGYEALLSNTDGMYNAAFGYQALYYNTTGDYNAAFGLDALFHNTTGAYNTASGYEALVANTTGAYNSASGYEALFDNTTGAYNTASGYDALYRNTSGQQNTALGVYALHNNTIGAYNTASGVDALYDNTSGHYNIAAGYKAGYNVTTGNYNIDIGNQGVAADSGVIRIGTQVPTPLQTNTYIAGIYTNTSVSGLTVVVDSNGQLGAIASSERFKTGITSMGSNTEKLQDLRPVTFHLKTDPKGALRYGLIAEEVAKVYPELVIRNESGRIDGVRYDELAPLLLKEIQQQQQKIAAQTTSMADQAMELRDLRSQVGTVAEQLRNMQLQLAESHAAPSQPSAKNELVSSH